MTINVFYKWINFMANKQQSGAVSPDEFNLCLEALSLEPLKIKLGLPEEYQIGVPFARQSYQVSQMITDDVRKFIKEVVINKNSSGYFEIPNDYILFSSMKYTFVGMADDCQAGAFTETQTIESVTDGELPFRLSNSIVPPTLDYPICAFYSGGIKVFPKEISQVELTYVRKPVTPFRNYLVTSNDEEIFDPNGSIDFEYPEIMHNDIAVLIAKYFGINLKDADLVNFAQTRQITGQ